MCASLYSLAVVSRGNVVSGFEKVDKESLVLLENFCCQSSGSRENHNAGWAMTEAGPETGSGTGCVSFRDGSNLA